MNIIVVDDEVCSLRNIELLLSKYGVFKQIRTANSFEEAMGIAKNERIDCALLDIELSDGNGFELAEELIKLNKKISIVFITAFNNYAAEAFELNAIDYLLKPVREDRFFRSMDRLILNTREKNIAEDDIVKINFFGKFEVSVSGDLMRWKRRKSMEIFAFLLQYKNEYVYKEKICEALWHENDPKKALINLQTAIYQLRRTIEESNLAGFSVDYSGNGYRVVTGESKIDYEEFLKYTSVIDEENPDLLSLTKAVGIYSGGFLSEEGWNWSRSTETMLEMRYQKVLEVLAKACIERDELEKSAEYLGKLLVVSPGNETATKLYFKVASSLFGEKRAKEMLKEIDSNN